LAFSPDGRLLASPWTLWDANTGANRHNLQGVQRPSLDSVGLAFSPDSERLATGRANGIQLWDTRTGQEVYSFKTRSPVTKLVFRADGGSLAAASANGTIQLLSAETVLGRTRLEGAQMAYFSPDGRLIAADGAGNAVLFDAFTGKRLRQLKGNEQSISCLAFSDDSKRLVVGYSDNELGVWDAETGDRIQRFDNLSAWVQSVDLSSDGSQVAAYLVVIPRRTANLEWQRCGFGRLQPANSSAHGPSNARRGPGGSWLFSTATRQSPSRRGMASPRHGRSHRVRK
jgi:hypothetical protein